jgi:tripartite-type tricarboxylate transporter receptor subunit TctC
MSTTSLRRAEVHTALALPLIEVPVRGRSFFIGLAVAALLAPSSVLCEPRYPARHIRLVVPFEPGGTIDVLSRILALLMSEDLGRTVIVENKPGAGGSIGISAAARAEPDGYTLVVGSAALVSRPSGNPKLPYDPTRDLTPVTTFATTPHFVLVGAAAPADTLADLISSARRAPGKFTYASSGLRSSAHLAGALFAVATGTRLLHVPYRGTGPAINDLIAGHVDMMFVSLPTAATRLSSAKLRALAVAAPDRVALLPSVPTVAEAGGPDLNVSSWVAILAPRGTRQSVKTRLAASVNQALRRPEVAWRFAALGALPLEQTVEQFEASHAAEIETHARLSREHPGLLD